MRSFCTFMLAVGLEVVSRVSGGAALLGVGGSIGTNTGGVSLKGASFDLDLSSGDLSRIFGSGLRIELDSLEIATSRGLLRYTPNAIEYIKNSMTWLHIFSENVVGLNHNSQPVLQIFAPDATPHYEFKMVGMGHFFDMYMDQHESHPALTNYCQSDRALSGASPQDVEACAEFTKASHLTVQAQFDYVSKLVLALVRRIQDSQVQLTNLASDRSESAAIKQEVLTELNSLLAQLKLEIVAENKHYDEAMANLTVDFNALHSVVGANQAAAQAQWTSLSEATSANFTEFNITLSHQLSSLQLALNDSVSQRVDDSLRGLTSNVTDMHCELEALRSEAVSNHSAARDNMAILNENMNSYVQELNATVASNWYVANERMDELNSSTTLYINTTLSALLEEVANSSAALNDTISAHIEHTKRKFGNVTASLGERLLELSDAVKANHHSFNSSLAEVQWNLTVAALEQRNVSDAAIAYLNSTLTRQMLNSAQNSEDLVTALSALNGTVADNYSFLGAQVALAREQLEGQLSSLSNNMSSSVATSNAVLSRVIGEVNSTAATQFTELENDLSLLAGKVSQSLKQLRDENVANLTVLYADLSVDVSGLRDSMSLGLAGLNDTVRISSDALRSDLLATKASVEDKLTLAIETQESERTQQHNQVVAALAAVNATVGENYAFQSAAVQQLESRLGERIVATNASVVSLASALNASIAETNSNLQALVNSTASSGESAVLSLSSRVVGLVAELNDSIASHHAVVLASVATLNASEAELHNFTRIVNNAKFAELHEQHSAMLVRLNSTAVDLTAQITTAHNSSLTHTNSVSDALSARIKVVNETLVNSSVSDLNLVLSRIGQLNASTIDSVALLTSSLSAHVASLGDTISLVNSSAVANITRNAEMISTTNSSLYQRLSELNNTLLAAQRNVNISLSTKIDQNAKETDSHFVNVNRTVAALGTTLQSNVSTLAALIAVSSQSALANLTTVNSTLQNQLVLVHAQIGANNHTQYVLVDKLNSSVSAQQADLNKQLQALDVKVDVVSAAANQSMAVLGSRIDAVNATAAAALSALSDKMAMGAEQQTAALQALQATSWSNVTSVSNSLSAAVGAVNHTLRHNILSSADATNAALAAAIARMDGAIVATNVNVTRSVADIHRTIEGAVNSAAAAATALQTKLSAFETQTTAQLSLHHASQVSINNTITEHFVAQLAVNLNTHRDVELLRSDVNHTNSVLERHMADMRSSLVVSNDHQFSYIKDINNHMDNITASVHTLQAQSLLSAQSLIVLGDAQKSLVSSQDALSERVRAMEVVREGESVALAHLSEATRLNAEHIHSVYNTTLPALMAAVGHNNGSINALISSISALQGELSTSSKQVADKMGVLNTHNYNNKQEIGALSAQLVNVGGDLSGRVDRIETNVTVKLDSLAESLLQTRLTSAQHDTKLEHLSTNHNTLSGTVSELARHDVVTAEKLSLLSVLEQKVATLTAQQSELLIAQNSNYATLLSKIETQSALLLAAQQTILKQGAEIAQLQDENKRLVRESATQEAVDQMRKLLYDMQASMIGHSGKVLDLLLNKPQS